MHGTALTTSADIEELLSIALLGAITARAGFVTSKLDLDRTGIDLFIHSGGPMTPCLGVQLKATINVSVKSGVIRYPLKASNYNQLCAPSIYPRILVLMQLPKDNAKWLSVSHKLLGIRNCAYWTSLEGMVPTTNTTSVTVDIPVKNLLTVPVLQGLMVKAQTGSLL